MMEFENRQPTSSFFGYLGKLDDCFTSGKALMPWEYGALNNNCIPTILSKKGTTCKGSGTGGAAFIINASRGAIYLAMLSSFPVGSIFALLAMGVEYVIMVDICSNAYIVAPHEYVNFKLDSSGSHVKCEDSGSGVMVNNAKSALTAIDIPFFYHCDPNYEPVSGKALDPNNPHDAELVGFTWGYMGSASPYCAAGADQYAQKDMVGGVVVNYMSGLSRFFNGRDRCQPSGRGSPTRGQVILNPMKGKNGEYMMPAHYHAYFRFSQQLGKVQLCVATPYTLFPIRVGCTYVPPPNQELEIDEYTKKSLSGTRCYHFLTGRTDLKSLGEALPNIDETGRGKSGTKRFLMSDLHLVSTVVGCIQDLLVKMFIDPVSSSGTTKPFFQTVQERLKQIVYSVLALYVCFIGMKIIISAKPPQQGEIVMYFVKFAVVIYFSVGSAWYDNQGGKQTGLYPSLLKTTEDIAGLFMGAYNEWDAVGLCSYKLLGSEVIGQRDLPVSAVSFGSSKVKNTYGYPGIIKMTTWDLIDCKIANYLSLGSCSYSIVGLIAVWLIGAAIFAGSLGFALSIVSLIYCVMIMMVILKFVHIVILSAFIITVLVVISPIIFCFMLFEYTKQIFQKWFSMILGYTLYPALLFAFIALMLSVFDHVFFGDLDLRSGKSLVEACRGVNSIFCVTTDVTKTDPCESGQGNIGNKITTYLDLGPLGKITIIKPAHIPTYMLAVLKLMLFAFIFYLFSSSVSSFLAILTGVQDVGSMALGGISIGKMLSAAGSAAAGIASGGTTTAGEAAGKAAQAAGKSVGSSGSGGGSGEGDQPRG
ncbi:Type IV secretion system protein VirB6 [Candidatus Cyrtobacter comes]|uniref:Type IV secretion system protein VirB6 n=2 Tax=Candidatus Cyrtobacter comes TaxID=675776 RepID=A0ABU5L903_9RICK|nr:Type IV secretion system protein VirB6 [Candidatus Cyrtobacter comes]